MATCPHCKGHLTEGHRCPQRRSLVVAEILGSAIAGGVAGWLLLTIVDSQGKTNMDGMAIAVGMLVAVGINRYIRS